MKFSQEKKEKKIRTTILVRLISIRKRLFFRVFISFVYSTLYHIPIFVIMNRHKESHFAGMTGRIPTVNMLDRARLLLFT